MMDDHQRLDVAVSDEARQIVQDITEGLRAYGYGSDPHPDVVPILYIDESTAVNRHVHELLKGALCPVVIVSTYPQLQAVMKERRIDPPITLEKLTALAQGMRSDAESWDLAEIVRAMPVPKLMKSEMKSSKRPVLPRNRKRDRWN